MIANLDVPIRDALMILGIAVVGDVPRSLETGLEYLMFFHLLMPKFYYQSNDMYKMRACFKDYQGAISTESGSDLIVLKKEQARSIKR